MHPRFLGHVAAPLHVLELGSPVFTNVTSWLYTRCHGNLEELLWYLGILSL